MKKYEVDILHRKIDEFTNNGILEIHANTLKQLIIDLCECDQCSADY